jgi:hypothetical protein
MTFFELTTELKSSLGTSCWVSDPLDPSKNATRPCYSFRSIQQLFASCLHRIEVDGGSFVYSYPKDPSKMGAHSEKGGGFYYGVPDEIDLLSLILSFR